MLLTSNLSSLVVMPSSVVRKIPGTSITLKWLFSGPQTSILKTSSEKFHCPSARRHSGAGIPIALLAFNFLSPNIKAMHVVAGATYLRKQAFEIIRRQSLHAIIFERFQFCLSCSVGQWRWDNGDCHTFLLGYASDGKPSCIWIEDRVSNRIPPGGGEMWSKSPT